MRISFIGDAGHTNLLSWARYLIDPLGHEVHVVTFNPAGEPVPGLIEHRITGWAARSKARYVLAIPQVRARIRAIAPDLVIGYRINSYGLLAALSGARPLVLVAQGSDLFYPEPSRLHRWVCRFTTGRADLLQTWASHMARELVALGGEPSRILTLPKGVDTTVFTAAGRVDRERRPTLVSTRQLRREYNHHLVLEAAARVVRDLPTLEYLLCGDGEHRGTLERQAEALGLGGCVRFLGRVEHRDLPQYIRSADVYVSLQPSDGVSASLLEAMACGAFPVVSDIEANRLWITDGENGFLVPPHDAEAVAARLLAAFEDPALRTRAREANVRIVESRGSMAANLRRMDARYRTLVSEGAHAAA